MIARWILSWAFVAPAICLAAEPRHTGPWDMAKLKQPPAAEFGEPDDKGVREVYYANEPYRGKPTRVFGYYAVPKKGTGPFPAMVCVHGGGGKAFREWAELWAERGYVALAMDLAGKGPDGMPLPDGGPNQTDVEKFGDFTMETIGDMWTYHAVAAVIRGHSLLASRPEVDAKRIGITGISWGGYLTCIVAGLDDRLKCAVPVYGCGFLGDNSTWLDRFAKMRPEQRELWLKQFDPSQYLGNATCPMLFVNGTNDFAYPLDSYQKSYRLPKGPVTLCIRPNMPHGHPQGWAPVEIGIFVDSVMKGGRGLKQIDEVKLNREPRKIDIGTIDFTPGNKTELHYAEAAGPWQGRKWTSVDVEPAQGGPPRAITDLLLSIQPRVFFLTVTDDRGALVSTPHVILEE